MKDSNITPNSEYACHQIQCILIHIIAIFALCPWQKYTSWVLISVSMFLCLELPSKSFGMIRSCLLATDSVFFFVSFHIQMLSSTCLQCCICTDADLVSGWPLWVAAFEKLDDNTTPHPPKHKQKHLFIHFIFTIFSFPPVFLVCTHAGDSPINVQLHFSLIKHT